MPSAGERLEACFGPLARALEPRSLGTSPAGDAHVACRAEPLASAARDEMAGPPAAGGAGAARWSATGPDELLWSGPPQELERLATRLPEALCLWVAHENAARPPGPARLMGVVNLTPDSFSDGGLWLDPERAVEHGLALAREGAAVLDLGGESTRPGARAVPVEEELERVLPALQRLARESGIPVSIDTRKGAVARAALAAGARLVNDTSAGLHDPEMLPLVAETGCGYLAMHMRGSPETMQRDPRYGDAPREVLAFLRGRAAACLAAGIRPERLTIDPGIGFGKALHHNLELLRRLRELRSLGLPICLGVSRKSFLGELSGERVAERRLSETAAALAAGVQAGAELLRVHDVAELRGALAVASALWNRRPAQPA